MAYRMWESTEHLERLAGSIANPGVMFRTLCSELFDESAEGVSEWLSEESQTDSIFGGSPEALKDTFLLCGPFFCATCSDTV